MKTNQSLEIKVGIVRDLHQYLPYGRIYGITCPKCGMPIRIVMSGIEDDDSLSPTVQVEARCEDD